MRASGARAFGGSQWVGGFGRSLRTARQGRAVGAMSHELRLREGAAWPRRRNPTTEARSFDLHQRHAREARMRSAVGRSAKHFVRIASEAKLSDGVWSRSQSG